MTAITAFQGEWRWLSNFWPCVVEFDGIFYPATENAYQAAKTLVGDRIPFARCSPGAAKRLGRSVVVRTDWDDAKVGVMRKLTQQKFAFGSPMADMLLATGGVEIVEGNTWGDTFWGVCNGRGLNTLGRLLMEQRAFLQEVSK